MADDASPRITHAMEDYLKGIYRLQGEGEVVTTQEIADELGISAASVTNMVKRLHELRLLRHTPYHGVRLTPAGEKIALEVLRHHRLLELYLAESLGYRWDEVHAEAERLEHHVSDELEARMDSALGFPTVDPHGDPIPSREGTITAVAGRRLLDLRPGEEAVVCRVSDREPSHLRFLGTLGIRPGVAVSLLERLPAADQVRIRVAGGDHLIDGALAAGVTVDGGTAS